MASGIDLIKGTSEVSGTEIVDKAGLPATAYDDLMESASREHGVPYEVLYRNLKQESGFNPKVVSPTGARGIAQFIPSTAKAMGIKDPHDPKEAIPGSAKYLRQLYDQFGDWKLAVAAYNAGPTAVSKAKGIPNIAETQKHVKAVFPGDVGEPVFDPKETQAAMSGLDLLKPPVDKVPKPAPSVSAPAPVPESTMISPREYYSKPWLSTYKTTGLGPKPPGGFDELGRALDESGNPYSNEGVDKEKVKGPIAETLKGLSSFVTQPMETVRGVVDFAASLPAFGVGLLGAAGRGTQELTKQLAYGSLNLDQVYGAMSKGMEESFKFFEPGKKLLVGEPTETSQLVGQVAMAPMNAISALGHKVAGYEGFSEYPNIRGAAKITGDVVGLMSMGLILHGPTRRAEFAKGAEEITREASEIATKEVEVNQTLDSVVKSVQQKQLEIEKQRLETKSAEFSRKFEDDLVMTEEMGRQQEQLAREKMRPVVESRPEMAEDYVPKPVKMTKAEAAKEARKGPETLEAWQYKVDSYPELKDKVKVDALGEADTTTPPGYVQITITSEGRNGTFNVKANANEIIKKFNQVEKEWKVEPNGEEAKRPVRRKIIEEPKVEEPVEEPAVGDLSGIRELPKNQGFEVLDPDTGDAVARFETRDEAVKFYDQVFKEEKMTAEELSSLDRMIGESDPSTAFEQSKEKMERLAKSFAEKGERVMEDPEVFLQKLINDANLWKSGKEIPIDKVRNSMSEIASRGSELRDFFITGADHLNFMEVASEAARWARNLKRPSEGGGTRLNVMIPFDMVPDTVKFWYKYTKGITGKIRASEVYRNEKLWKDTGFWLARDGKWRFELDDSKAKYSPSGYPLSEYKKTGKGWEFLRSALDYPELYKAIPKLKDTVVEFDVNLNRKGQYNIDSNVITIKVPHDKKTLFHEIAHGINRAGGAFSGGSTYGVLVERTRKIIKDLKDVAKTKEVTDEIVSVEKDFNIGKIGVNEAGEKLIDIVERRAPSSADKFVKTLNNVLNQNSAFEAYRRIPGEMESRLTEARLDMTKAERMSETPWVTLDKMLDREGIGYDSGLKLYSGIPVDEAAKMIVAGARKVAEYTNKARGLKELDIRSAARAVRQEFNRSFIDRSGNIRTELLDKLGDPGYKIVQKMYLSKGSSSVAANMLKQMRKETTEGLNRHEKKVFDDVVLDLRMIDIGKYKSESEFKYPNGLKLNDFIAHLELFQQLEKLSPERAYEIYHENPDGSPGGRVGAYYEWMKKPLKDMLDNGLISKEEYDALSSHNYRRIKLVEIYDKRNTMKVGKKSRTVYDSGVESLAHGRDTDIYEPSSEIMALEVFNRAYGRILNNEANKSLLELARNDPTNDFARVKQKGTDSEKIPAGWHRVFAYEDGQRKSLYISPEMSKEWIVSSPELSYKMSQLLRYASGSPVLRTMATGINWGFALANMPRDIMHAWFTARSFENGQWKPVYNPNFPVFSLQMGRDLASVFTDAALKKGRYQDYINEGGGMEFLVHQGRLFRRGRHLESPMDKVMDFMGYFGETSEVLTRLAIRERALRKGKSPQEATFIARDYMDFGQGGGIAKALDNAFPYLNASIQGSRGLFRSFQPGSGSALSSTYKLSQLAAITTGVYIASQSMAPKTHESLKGSVDSLNNLVIPLGDEFGFLDDKGQMRYPYIKIPLDPGQKFFKTFFEASADKWLGNEVDVDRVTESLQSVSPVGISSLPPTMSAVLGYVQNKDFWLNEDIWRQTDRPFSWPQSREEYTSRTPQSFKDLGKVTGLSPERSKYALEQLITKGTIFSYLLGQGYDAAFGDMPKSNKEEHIAQVIAKTPAISRFFGITNPYSKYASKINKAAEDAVVKRFMENRGMDTLVEGHLYDKNVSLEEINKYVRSFKDVDTADRLMERFMFEKSIKNLPEKSFWRRMKGLPTEAKAKVFVDRLNKADDEEKKQLWKEYGIVSAAGGVVGDEFMDEVSRLIGEQKKQMVK